MNNPLVSIVMAAYNEEKHIREAIDSILIQTYENYEFLIINDGSTDNTGTIISSYNDKRIKCITNEKNLKLIDSLNKGLAEATGKYIARMDADDICTPNRLEQQVKFMEANPEIGISGSQLLIFGGASGIMAYPLNHEEIKLHLLFTSAFGNNVVIFRTDLLKKHELFFPKGYLHAEDYKSWTNWVMHTRTANLDQCLVKYRSHSNSISAQNRELQRKTRNRVRAEYISTLFNMNDQSSIVQDFTGRISLKRLKAIKQIIKLNEEKKVFDQKSFLGMIQQLWYADALEQVETDFFVFLKYRYIFSLDLEKNLTNWVNVLKHYIKIKVS